MQAKDVVVRVQALDGAWETLGADRARGITPENVQLTSDQWGSKTASFDLRRDPKAVWPDITAFTPVEVEVGGRLVWSGRVSESPVRDSTDSVINVQCEGWQAHLDDEVYEQVYAHTNLADWRDARQIPDVDLTRFRASGVVNTGAGEIVIGYPNGSAVVTDQVTGVILDMGPTVRAKSIVVNWSNQGTTGTSYRFLSTAFDNVGDWLSPTTSETLLTFQPSTASSPQYSYVSTPRRYIAIYLRRDGANATETADRLVRITSIQVFTSRSYESGNVSVLKADQVVKDVINNATFRLNSDQSAISAGTFSIPELAPSEPKTPRELWNAVNAFEDYQAEIDVFRRPVFRAKPTSPEVEVGAWSGMEFEDSSANSGENVYSGVVVTGTKANGDQLRVARSQVEQAGVLSSELSPNPLSNPSFDSDASGWTASVGSLTRDTGVFDSSPASGKWAFSLMSTGPLTTNLTGTFSAGKPYVFEMKVRMTAGSNPALALSFGTTSDRAVAQIVCVADTWVTAKVTWRPRTTVTSDVQVRFTYLWSSKYSTSSTYYLDTARIFEAQPTIVERRRFARTKQLATNFTLTETAAQQIADKWLLSHKTSPFRGRAKLTGNQACREIKTGRNVSPEELLLRTGELIRFGDRIDPDTGAAGRDGRLVEAQYNADEDSVNLTIDSSRAGFEALLERLGVVLGQNRFS